MDGPSRGTGRVCATAVALVLSCLAIASPAAGGQPPDTRRADYCFVIRLYVDRAFKTLVPIASAWSMDELAQALQAPPSCNDPSVTTEAAVVLATDLAGHLGGTIELVADRLAVVESAVKRLPKTHARFQEEWYVAASSLLLAWTSADRGALMADRGLQRVPGSARLRMLIGKAEEMRIHGRDGNLHDSPVIRTMARNISRSALGFAESNFRRALEADPNLHEARLHLGRVLFLHQDLDGARAALTQVTADAGESRLRYLAHLFLGAIDEFEGDRDAARRHYEDALACGPEYQTAYIALSFVEAALGHHARARELVARWSHRRDDEIGDPWWDYQNGGVDADAFEWLHAQVLK